MLTLNIMQCLGVFEKACETLLLLKVADGFVSVFILLLKTTS